MVERIYIGGLDPPRLTAEEVASRLEGIDGVEIRSKDHVGNDKQFFYVNAVSQEDDGMSALDKIAKQYNNVTWKRCKLVVQAARPHFLERLAQQRSDAAKQEAQQERKESKAIPRHLRIRQKFGEEAHQVDTKPCRTSEWSDFCRVVSKLRTRREEHSEVMRHGKREQRNETTEAKKKAFRNRAVHLRWSENLNGNSSEPSLVDITSDASVNDESEGTSSTTSQSESDSDEPSASDSHQLKNGRHSAYVWSDDDESDESSDEGGAGVIEEPCDRVGDFDEGQASLSSDESVSSESEDFEKEAMVASCTQGNARVEQSSAQYEWSSDVSGDQEDSDPPQRNASSLKPESSRVATKEFSAAIDFDSSSDDASDDSGSDSNERIDIPVDSQNLDDDVKANLGVLSSLFPDMAETKPMSVDMGSNSDKGQSGSRSETMQPGWEMVGTASMSAGLGSMQRFDPRKESAKKYIIKPTKPSVEIEPAGEASDDGVTDSSSEMEKDERAASTSSSSDDESESAVVAVESEEGDTKTAVYEQSKLEGIFREARSSDGSENFKMSSLFDSKVEQGSQAGNGKSFAFGFDVGKDTTTTKQPTSESGTFAFSFDIGSKEPQNSGRGGENGAGAARISESNGTEPNVREEKSVGEHEQAGDSSVGIQRRGLFFPEDTLDEYTAAFFAMNEGSRIRQDPQGFLRDEGVKQQWKKERHSLTLDWKRKRKYAQSRMQKKMKFR